MIMNQVRFYREIVNRGVYSIFNELRDGLFGKLATDSHLPIAYSKLDEVISECEHLHSSQIDFIKDSIEEGNRFRFHECLESGLQIYYFVNVSKEAGNDREIAAHLQTRYDVVHQKVLSTSTIVLFEKHPKLHPIKYPKVIKHELSHAAIEFIIGNDKDLCEFYFSDDPKIAKFIEFICDIIPYLSSPSKKENGINKFIEDSVECFGYDAEDGDPAEFIKVIIESMECVTMDEVPDNSSSYEEFKSLKDKYVFALLKTDGHVRMELLGVTKAMYTLKENADRWKSNVKEILCDGEYDEDTEKALEQLEILYQRMI